MATTLAIGTSRRRSGKSHVWTGQSATRAAVHERYIVLPAAANDPAVDAGSAQPVSAGASTRFGSSRYFWVEACVDATVMVFFVASMVKMLAGT